MANAENWGRRVIDSRGGHFRIDSGNPQQTLAGPETVKIYATNDNGEVFTIAHAHGEGLGRIACDKTIEIRAGDKNDPNNIDIRISAATGDITINADRGRVRVNAKDIMMTADRDIDLKAGRNLNLQSGSGRILLKGNTAQVKAKRGNLVPETWGARVSKNSFIPDDTLSKIFDPAAQTTSLGAAPGSFDGVPGGALKGYGFTLEDLGISAQTGGVESIEKAVIESSSSIINPLQKASNLLEGKLDDPLGSVLEKAGAGDLVNKVKGGLDAVNNPVKTALGLSGLDSIPGSTTIANAAKNYLGGQLPGVGSAMDVIKGTGNKVLTGSLSSLTSSAASALGVKPGGNALTGLKTLIGTGSVAKGAAATIGNMSGDALASLPVKGVVPTHPDIPDEKKIKDVSNATAMYMENLAQDLLRAANDPNLQSKVEGAIKDLDLNKTLLQGEEIISDLKATGESMKPGMESLAKGFKKKIDSSSLVGDLTALSSKFKLR
tara:strand:+ start:2574 stop:4049 length:1476 start_codon:yes stop_codon:yes gene_type:complete